jgi:hypothetical protein
VEMLLDEPNKVGDDEASTSLDSLVQYAWSLLKFCVHLVFADVL